MTNYKADRGAVIMSTCSSSLSIIASFMIIGSYVFIPKIRNSTRKLVTCLTVADFLTALGYLISALAHYTNKQNEVCEEQSIITTYSSLVSFNLTMAIAVHIFFTVVYRKDTTSSRTFLLCTNIICWFIPGIIVGIAYDVGVIGKDPNSTTAASAWCWLKRDDGEYTLWVFLSGKGWEFLCYLIATTVYVLLKWNRRLNHNKERFQVIQESLRNEDKNYLYVWLVLYILRLWGSARYMLYLAHANETYVEKKVLDVLMFMQAIGDPAQAFCNFILFCVLDKTVRDHVFRKCCSSHSVGNLPQERTHLLPGATDNHTSNTHRAEFLTSNEVRDECLLECSGKHSSRSSQNKDASV